MLLFDQRKNYLFIQYVTLSSAWMVKILVSLSNFSALLISSEGDTEAMQACMIFSASEYILQTAWDEYIFTDFSDNKLLKRELIIILRPFPPPPLPLWKKGKGRHARVNLIGTTPTWYFLNKAITTLVTTNYSWLKDVIVFLTLCVCKSL